MRGRPEKEKKKRKKRKGRCSLCHEPWEGAAGVCDPCVAYHAAARELLRDGCGGVCAPLRHSDEELDRLASLAEQGVPLPHARPAVQTGHGPRPGRRPAVRPPRVLRLGGVPGRRLDSRG